MNHCDDLSNESMLKTGMDGDKGSLSNTIFSLLDVTEDREPEVRNAALDALVVIAKQHFVATTSLLLQYRIKHKAAVGEHARSAVWACLTNVTTVETDLKSELGIDVFTDLLTAAAEDVSRERASSEPATMFLLKCFSTYNAEVFSSLMYLVEKYASDVTASHAPAFPASLFDALNRVFAQNSRSVLPYMGRYLAVLVSIMPATGIKASKDRMLIADTLEVLADVMQENTTSFEREISNNMPRLDQQALAAIEATLAADQQQFNRCYTTILSDWLHAKSVDPELQCALMGALGALAVVVSIEKLTDTAVSLHKVSVDLLRRHPDNARCCSGAVNCLYYLTLGAPKLLEPHIDMTLELLFELSCRKPDFSLPSAVKAHNEVIRGYTVLGRYFTDRAFNLLLQRLENVSKVTRQLRQQLTPGEQHPQEVIAIGALTLLNKLLQFDDIQIRPVIPAIVALVKKTTALNAPYPFTKNSVKQALLMTLLTFADTSAVELTTANFPIEFIIRCCAMPIAEANQSNTSEADEQKQLNRTNSSASVRRHDSSSTVSTETGSNSTLKSSANNGSRTALMSNNQNNWAVTDVELCNVARNTLTLMCEAVVATQRLFWPSLFLYFMPAQYTRATDILAKLLRRLALLPIAALAADPKAEKTGAISPSGGRGDGTESASLERLAILADYGDSSVPTLPALFARLFILCGSRWRPEHSDDADDLFYAERAQNCLLLMTTLMPVLRPEAQSVWNEACRKLLSPHSSSGKDTNGLSPAVTSERQWQEELLHALTATLDVDAVQLPSAPNEPVSGSASNSQWPDLLAQSLAQHITIYANVAEQLPSDYTTERLYLYVTLAAILLYIPATEEHASSTVGKCLDLMLNTAHHEDLQERMWLAHAVGKIAQMHMETVMNKMAQFEKSFLAAGGKGGNNQGFLKSLLFAPSSSSSATTTVGNASLASANSLADSGSSVKHSAVSPSHVQATVLLCYGCVVKLLSPVVADAELVLQNTPYADENFPDLSFLPLKLHVAAFCCSDSDNLVENLRQMDKIARHVCHGLMPVPSSASPKHESGDVVVNFPHRHALCCFASWYANSRCALLNAAPSSLLATLLAPPAEAGPAEATSPRVAIRNGGRAVGLLSRMSIGSLHSSTHSSATKTASAAPDMLSSEAVVQRLIKNISHFLQPDAVLLFDSSASILRVSALSALTDLVRLDLHVEKLSRQHPTPKVPNVAENDSNSSANAATMSSNSSETLGADKVAEIRPLLELCLHEILTLTPPGEENITANKSAIVETNHITESSAKLQQLKRPSAASMHLTSITTTYIADKNRASTADHQSRALQICEASAGRLKTFCTTLLHILPTPLMFNTLLELLTPYIESDAEWEQRSSLDVLNAVLSQMDQEFPSFVVEPTVGTLFALLVPRCFDVGVDADNEAETKTTKQYAVFCMVPLLKHTTHDAKLLQKDMPKDASLAAMSLPNWYEPFALLQIQPNTEKANFNEQHWTKGIAQQICRALVLRHGQEQLVTLLLRLTSSALLDLDRSSSVAGSIGVVEHIFQQICTSERQAAHGSDGKAQHVLLQPEHIKQLVVNLGIAHRYISATATTAGSTAAVDDLLAGCERCIAALALISRESLQQCCDTLLYQPLPFDVTVCRFWFAIAEAVSAEKDAEPICGVLVDRVLHLIVEESQYTTPYAVDEQHADSRIHYNYANLSLLQHLCALLEILRAPAVRRRVLDLRTGDNSATDGSGCEDFVRLFAALVNIVQALVVARPARMPREKYMGSAAISTANGSSPASAAVVNKKSSLPRFKWLKSPLASATKLSSEAKLESAPTAAPTTAIIDGDMNTSDEFQRVVNVRPVNVAIDTLKETLRYAGFPVNNFNWLMLIGDAESCAFGLELIVTGVLERLTVVKDDEADDDVRPHYDLSSFVEQLAQRCARSMSSPIEPYRIAGTVVYAAILKIAAREKIDEDSKEKVWLESVINMSVKNLMSRLQSTSGGPGDPSVQVRRWCVRALGAVVTSSLDAELNANNHVTTNYVNDIDYVRCFVSALDDRDESSSPVVALEACDALRHVLARTKFDNILEICNSCATKLKPLINLDIGSRHSQQQSSVGPNSVEQSSVVLLLRLQKYALLAFAALAKRFDSNDQTETDKSSEENARASLVEHIHAVLISVMVRVVSSPPSQHRYSGKAASNFSGRGGTASWPSSASDSEHELGMQDVVENDVPEAALHCLRSVLLLLLSAGKNSTSATELDAIIPTTAVPFFNKSSSAVVISGSATVSSSFIQLADATFAELFSVSTAAENGDRNNDSFDADSVESEKWRQLYLSNAASLAAITSTAELRAAAVIVVGCLLTSTFVASTCTRTRNDEKGISRPVAIASLVKLLKDPDTLVRRCAAVSIARIFQK